MELRRRWTAQITGPTRLLRMGKCIYRRRQARPTRLEHSTLVVTGLTHHYGGYWGMSCAGMLFSGSAILPMKFLATGAIMTPLFKLRTLSRLSMEARVGDFTQIQNRGNRDGVPPKERPCIIGTNL